MITTETENIQFSQVTGQQNNSKTVTYFMNIARGNWLS